MFCVNKGEAVIKKIKNKPYHYDVVSLNIYKKVKWYDKVISKIVCKGL